MANKQFWFGNEGPYYSIEEWLLNQIPNLGEYTMDMMCTLELLRNAGVNDMFTWFTNGSGDYCWSKQDEDYKGLMDSAPAFLSEGTVVYIIHVAKVSSKYCGRHWMLTPEPLPVQYNRVERVWQEVETGETYEGSLWTYLDTLGLYETAEADV